MTLNTPHLVFVQYGDYREAYERLSQGGAENYASQKYSIEFVANLIGRMRVTVIALPPDRYDLLLGNGVRAIGMGWKYGQSTLDLLLTLEKLRPTHLVVNTPLLPALFWGVLRAKRVLPNFADSFTSVTLRGRLKEWFLVSLLNTNKIDYVTNHNLPASRNLVKIGVRPEKVLPWDWPSHITPFTNEPKEAPNAALGFSIFYVGLVLESKGVGDLINAVAVLRKKNMPVTLTIAGTGEVQEMQLRALELGISDVVNFKGRVANTDVLQFMREHDAVVVPSRRSYPEGLPMAIYEGLCSRTPLIVSSHPMFLSPLKDKEGVLMFDESDADSLAKTISILMHDSELYKRVSQFSAPTWESIQVPLKTGELLTRWLSGSTEDLSVLSKYAIDKLPVYNVHG